MMFYFLIIHFNALSPTVFSNICSVKLVDSDLEEAQDVQEREVRW